MSSLLHYTPSHFKLLILSVKLANFESTSLSRPNIDAIVFTFLDVTAKGGIVFAIAKQYGIPVKYVGVGEGIDDIVEFDAKEFVEGII